MNKTLVTFPARGKPVILTMVLMLLLLTVILLSQAGHRVGAGSNAADKTEQLPLPLLGI